jgi:hypothetical protein
MNTIHFEYRLCFLLFFILFHKSQNNVSRSGAYLTKKERKKRGRKHMVFIKRK